jgi:hypothetical protein
MSFASRVARLFLVAALICAQHGAIAHGVWHFGGAGAAQQSGQGEGTLCDQHTALGTVLGALGNAAAAQPALAQRACPVPAPALACAPAAVLVPSSRDPPALL